MFWLSISAIIRQGWGDNKSLSNTSAHFLSFYDIVRCLQSLRPYHGLLLLVEASELLDHLPPDASPALVRLVRMYSPLKSLQTLSADADLTLSQVCGVECWGCSIHASDPNAMCMYTALAIWIYFHGAEPLTIVCNHHHHPPSILWNVKFLYLQQTTACPYSEPDESNWCRPIVVL